MERISTKKSISQMHFKKASGLHSITIIQINFYLLQNRVKFQILVILNAKAGKDLWILPDLLITHYLYSYSIFSEQSSVAHNWMSACGCSKSHKHETDLHWCKLSQEVAPMCAPRQQNATPNDWSVQITSTSRHKVHYEGKGGKKNTSSLKAI